MEEDLGVTEERDFAPEGRRFFKILGRRLFVTRTFEIAISCIVSFELTFTFWLSGEGGWQDPFSTISVLLSM